jgi:hypothetical protein
MLRNVLIGLACCLASPSWADEIPSCRLDNTFKQVVATTLAGAVAAYVKLGKPLAVQAIEINPTTISTAPGTLTVFVVRDAAQAAVDPNGCTATAPGKTDALDSVSVSGGCKIVAIERMEMRCSSSAVRIFGGSPQDPTRPNPALLYLMAHELAHIIQRRIGEYGGRAERINLADKSDVKLQNLRAACEPSLTTREQQADTMALDVLRALLAAPPYREPMLSEKGSMYANINRLAVATNTWQEEAVVREFMSWPKLHAAFNPTEFPTPPAKVRVNARRFVCDVLTKNRGSVLYPGRSGRHPPIEDRLRRITELLQPIADGLPTGGGHPDFQPIVKIVPQVGDILAKIYRDTGEYLAAVQQEICTQANALTPRADCR